MAESTRPIHFGEIQDRRACSELTVGSRGLIQVSCSSPTPTLADARASPHGIVVSAQLDDAPCCVPA